MLRRKNTKYRTLQATTLATLCLLALTACSSDETVSTPQPDQSSKTPIELTVGIVGEGGSGDTRGTTRGVVTTGTNMLTPQAFSGDTKIFMVLKGDNETVSPATSKYIRTAGSVKSGKNAVSFGTEYVRYWEDAYARDTKLSIYSVCVPGVEDATAWTIGSSADYNNAAPWSNTAITPELTWPLRGTSVDKQDENFVINQDLCFSNNVSNLSGNTPEDNRIAFNTTTNKFTTDRTSGNNPERGGNMIFYHALTKVTFKIKKGTGFISSDPFEFPDDKNVELKGFYTEGTFNIVNGEFNSTSMKTTTISKLAKMADETGFAHVLSGLMLPGTNLYETTPNTINITIDNNEYHIKKSELLNALKTGDNVKQTENGTSNYALSNNSGVPDTHGTIMRPGVHYVFEVTISKQAINNITAKVVSWEEVTAEEQEPSNARITVSLLDNGIKKSGTADFDLYRTPYEHSSIDDDYADYDHWASGYTTNKAYLTENTTNSGVYTAYSDEAKTSPWYWPNNKTFYHFRSVMPTATTVSQDDNNGDYITISYGTVDTAHDICWGAPFANTTGKLTYQYETNGTGKGFDGTSASSHQIYKGIGPTTENIVLEMFHMMSEVTINLTTTDGTDAVTIDEATMVLDHISASGKVRMGNGLVIPDAPGTPGTQNHTYVKTEAPAEETPWHNYFVPQSLADVKLTITTTDGNQYEVDMKNVEATAAKVGNNLLANPYKETTTGSGKYKIDRWYPNYQYTYTFKLKKTGIEKIYATLAKWEPVDANSQDVTIK